MESPSAAEENAVPRRANVAVLGIPALAALLALAVWLWTPRLGGLGSYELSIVEPAAAASGVLLAGGEGARVALAPNGGLKVVLRPHDRSDPHLEAVEAGVFLEGPTESAPLTTLLASSVALPGGGLEVALRRTALPREGRLRLLVGRTGKLPGSPSGTAAHGRDWQRFDISFTQPAPGASP